MQIRRPIVLVALLAVLAVSGCGKDDAPSASNEAAPPAGSVVTWKEEDYEDDGEAVGPVWIIYPDDSEKKWDRWVRRSEAVAYAKKHRLEFFPQ